MLIDCRSSTLCDSYHFPNAIPCFFSSEQIKEAVLSGVALEDEQREKFNQIEQVSSDFFA
jgi:hypothetical protein